jgi:hypothetical protein
VPVRLRGALIIFVVGLSACGGTSSAVSSSPASTRRPSTPSPPPKVYDESKVEAALTKAKTSRYEAVSGLSKTRLSGEVDYPRRFVTWHSDSGNVPDLAFLHTGSLFYLRRPTGQWCLQSNAAEPHEPAPSGIGALLGSLVPVPPKDSHPRYVGSEKVRGVTTSRFHFGGATPVDLWVDGQDLMRRVSEESATLPFSEEFFDYGANVTFAAPTAMTPKCQHG